MSTDDYLEYLDELDTNDGASSLNKKGRRSPKNENLQHKKRGKDVDEVVKAQDDSARNLRFTYKAARFEEWWLLDSLGEFYEHNWISDVLRRIKGGKEASVYLCRLPSSEKLAAAKVYRPRSLRNLKNDALYRMGRADLDDSGRVIFDDKSVHAMQKRTSFGEELRHQSWIAYEFQSLQSLHAAGADVPRPYAMAKNAILMEYIGDGAHSAPTLNTVTLEMEEARSLFSRCLYNIDLMLTDDRIHGDLSSYNILYWQGKITLIDFPQVVKPKSNPVAWSIFQRDIARLCKYFETQGIESDCRRLSAELWTSHGYKIHSDLHLSEWNVDPSDF
jgi:RIO kinase 1